MGFSALMMLGFSWRVVYSTLIMRSYLTSARAPLLAAAGMPVTLVCDAASLTLWVVNFIWLDKLIK